MKILMTVDSNPYSENAVTEVSALAANTWANITFLGVDTKSKNAGPDKTMQVVLDNYLNTFLTAFPDGDCPYSKEAQSFGWRPEGPGVQLAYEQDPLARKTLIRKTRSGNPVKAVLAEIETEQPDLVVIGCNPPPQNAGWPGHTAAPQQIVRDAPCSVMVVKHQKDIDHITWCLDQRDISQASLELINQLLTIHKAGLTLVGFSDEKGELKNDIEQRMHKIINYYTPLNINPLVESVNRASLDTFISQNRSRELMVLGMGTQSIWRKWLTKQKMNKLIKDSLSSVMILR